MGLHCFVITPQRRSPCVVLPTAKNFHRIAVKKLRYAGDFFGRLFSGHKAKKRLSAYEDSLKELQDPLGALNDIQVQQKWFLSWLQESHAPIAASASLPPVSCLGANRVKSNRF